MRRPTASWLIIVLASSLAACGTDGGTSRSALPVVVSPHAEVRVAANDSPGPSPDAAAQSPAASPSATPGTTVFRVYPPIVGFHARTGVGLLAPVSIGFVIAQPWTSDPNSPTPAVKVEMRLNGGAFARLSPAHTQITGLDHPTTDGLAPDLPDVSGDWWSMPRTLDPSGTVAFRVRAQDPVSGTWSPWMDGRTLRPRALQETSPVFTYSSGWSRASGATLLGGGAEIAATAGSMATASFNASSVAWVALRGPDGGMAEVRVDGALAASIDLRQTVFPDQTTPEIVFAQTWGRAGPHTLSINVVGRVGSTVNIDELLVIG